MNDDADIRRINQDEIHKLMDLYKHLHPDDGIGRILGNDFGKGQNKKTLHDGKVIRFDS